jgi:hypothetical protein
MRFISEKKRLQEAVQQTEGSVQVTQSPTTLNLFNFKPSILNTL